MSVKTIERPAVSDEAILPVRNVGLWIAVAAAVSLLVGGLVWLIVRSPAVEEPAAAEIGWSSEARAAEAARWAARAEVYARVRAQQAEADRLTGIALAAGLTPAQQAEKARWGAYAEAFRAERARDAWTERLAGLAVYTLPELLDGAQQAEADRLTGLAEYMLPEMLNRAQQAEADRLTGLAEYLLPEMLNRAQRAEADRLTELAEHMGR